MSNERILIVEDEKLYSDDIKNSLKRLGYKIAGTASSGEEAIVKSKTTQPDLILMDIVLLGKMDGVESAEKIHAHNDIPVIYLTGLTGENILKRAKITEPYGYIVKPFQERELHTVIEIALYKHKIEEKMRVNESKLEAMLQSIGDYMTMMDKDLKIIWINEITRKTFGDNILGKSYCEVFSDGEKECNPETYLSLASFKDKKIHRFEKEVFDQQGRRLHFSCTANVALKDKEGHPETILEIARDITPTIQLEGELARRLEEVQRFNKLMVGRELKMRELKEENEKLNAKLETSGGKKADQNE